MLKALNLFTIIQSNIELILFLFIATLHPDAKTAHDFTILHVFTAFFTNFAPFIILTFPLKMSRQALSWRLYSKQKHHSLIDARVRQEQGGQGCNACFCARRVN